MKTILASASLAALVATGAAAEPIGKEARERLIAHLEMTERWLVTELEDVSATQMRYRSAPDTWSILDVVEHLAVAEPQYWKTLQDSLKQPAAPFTSEATDARILWYGIDRTRRARTGEARVPTGRWNHVKPALAEFRKLRAAMLEEARTTQEDLRGRRLIGGNMDVYQWFLMISSHSQRHILQIREIKAHPSYPRA